MDIDPNRKCIKEWQQRNHYGRICDSQEWIVTIPQALENLLKWELGFGGQVTEVSKTSVTVVTDVLGGGCVDTVILSGSEEDMAPLLQAIYFWAQATEKFRDLAWDKALQTLPQEKGGGLLPFYVVNFGPLLYGENIVKIAMLMALGVTETDMERCMKLRFDDIRPAIELASESRVPLPEVLNQLAII